MLYSYFILLNGLISVTTHKCTTIGYKGWNSPGQKPSHGINSWWLRATLAVGPPGRFACGLLGRTGGRGGSR